MTDNKKYVKCGQVLIIRDDPQRYEEMAGANRNKVSAPLQYAGSPFVALAVVKSMTDLPYRHLQGSEDAVTCQCARHGNAAARIAPFKRVREAHVSQGVNPSLGLRRGYFYIHSN